MPQILSLQIDETRIRGVLASVAPGRVDVQHTFSGTAPTSLLGPDAGQSHAWLKDLLTPFRSQSDQVVVSISREASLLRRLDLPNVPAAELPVHVSFQARTRLAQPLDTLQADFLPAPTGSAALFTAISKSHSQALQSALTAAGLKTLQIRPAPISMMELLGAAKSDACILLHLVDDRLELLLFQQGVLLVTHGTRLCAEDPLVPQILAETTRGLLAFQKLIPPNAKSQFLILAEQSRTEELQPLLERRLGQPVAELTWPGTVRFQHPEEPNSMSEFAEAVGGALAFATAPAKTVNWLAPRRPQPKRDYRKRRIGILAAGLVAIIATGGYLYSNHWSDLSKKASALDKEDRSNAALLKRADPDLKSGLAVEGWQNSKVNWLEELKQFTPLLPPSDKLYLTSVEMVPQVGNTNSTLRGRISIHGLAKQRDDVIKLETAAVNIPLKYQVLPHKVTVKTAAPAGQPQPNSPPGQPGQGGQPQQNNPYPVEFDLTVNLNTVDPKLAAAQAKTPEPSKGNATAPATSPPAAGSNTKPTDKPPESPKSEAPKPTDANPTESKPGATPPAASPGTPPATSPPSAPGASPPPPSATPSSAPATPAAPMTSSTPATSTTSSSPPATSTTTSTPTAAPTTAPATTGGKP